VYAAHINNPYRQLELYRFYTDSVVLQHVYALHSQQVDLLVVDNVLVVLHLDTGMAMLVDVYSDTTSTTPLARAMLPLGLLVAVPHQRRLDEEHRQQVQLRNFLKEQQRLKQQALAAVCQQAGSKGGSRTGRDTAGSTPRDRSSEVQAGAGGSDQQQGTAGQEPQQPTLQEELAGYLMVVVPGPWPLTYTHWRFTLPNLVVDPVKQVHSRGVLSICDHLDLCLHVDVPLAVAMNKSLVGKLPVQLFFNFIYSMVMHVVALCCVLCRWYPASC
jgi:hypothetical protein